MPTHSSPKHLKSSPPDTQIPESSSILLAMILDDISTLTAQALLHVSSYMNPPSTENEPSPSTDPAPTQSFSPAHWIEELTSLVKIAEQSSFVKSLTRTSGISKSMRDFIFQVDNSGTASKP